MDTQIIKKWIAALRSGKYKQGRNKLRDKEDCYCCLGVLCDIVAPTKWTKIESDARWFNLGHWEFPSKEIMRKVGIKSRTRNILVSMNDYNKISFDEIADYLENILKKKQTNEIPD
jgi:hypothetical protein